MISRNIRSLKKVELWNCFPACVYMYLSFKQWCQQDFLNQDFLSRPRTRFFSRPTPTVFSRSIKCFNAIVVSWTTSLVLNEISGGIRYVGGLCIARLFLHTYFSVSKLSHNGGQGKFCLRLCGLRLNQRYCVIFCCVKTVRSNITEIRDYARSDFITT